MAILLLVILLIGMTDGASVCYGTLGCFSDAAPFTDSHRPNPMVPASPDHIKTKLQLYTREAKTVPQNLDPIHPDTLGSVWTHFKVRPTKFIIHGFLDDPNISPWMKQMKDEFLTKDDFNVVIVDWSHGNLLPYGQAAANTRVVGAQIASIVNLLISSHGVTADSFHIIGHSLGAHTAGYAGERIPGLGRITGLDPAGPDFANTDKVVRLDPSDAKFVDVIHTDAQNLLLLGFGMKQEVGHSDFYPNNGHDQPGCTRDPLLNILENGIIQGIEEEAACNHLRSIKFFIESINTHCTFSAFPCASEDDFKNHKCQSCTTAGCASMGYNANQHIPSDGTQAKYYLTTNSHAPFCKS